MGTPEAPLDLARSIKVNAQPLSPQEWEDLLQDARFEVLESHQAPLAQLSPARLVADEGLAGAAHFLRNVLRDRDARERVLGMRAVLRRHRRVLRGIAIVARRTAGPSSGTTQPDTTTESRSVP